MQKLQGLSSGAFDLLTRRFAVGTVCSRELAGPDLLPEVT